MEDIEQLLHHMKESHDKVKVLHENCARLRSSAEAGAGAVQATVDGNKMVRSLDIHVDYVCPEGKEMLQDLIIAAVNMANEKVEKLVESEVKKGTEKLLSEFVLNQEE